MYFAGQAQYKRHFIRDPEKRLHFGVSDLQVC